MAEVVLSISCEECRREDCPEDCLIKVFNGRETSPQDIYQKALRALDRIQAEVSPKPVAECVRCWEKIESPRSLVLSANWFNPAKGFLCSDCLRVYIAEQYQ